MPHYSSNILAPPYNYDVPSGDAPGQIPVWDGQFWKVGEGGSPLFIKPLGGGADDWPRLNSILAAAAGVAPVVMGPGIWNCATPGVVPSNTVLIGGPNVLIKSTLAFSGGAVLNCIFDTGRPTNTLRTTLAAGNTPGASTISTNASLAVGTIIGIHSLFGSLLRWAYYTVKQVTGGGPFTLTLDRPVLNQYALNDEVYSVPSRANGIYIFGNGMRISGTGDTALQFWQAFDCHAFDVHIDSEFGALGDFSAELDLGCNNCDFTRVWVDSSGLGIGMASAEACTFRDCRSEKTLGGLGAFNIFDTQECTLDNCEGYGAGAGVIVGSNGNNGGCQNTLIGGKFWSNIQGIQVTAGSKNTVIDASVRFNGTGIIGINASGTPANIRVRGDVSSNTTRDINVDPSVIPGFTVEPRTLLYFGAGIVDAGGNTLALYPGEGTDATFASGGIRPIRVPKGVLRNLRVSHGLAGANAGSNVTYTVYVNGAPSTLTCAVDVTALSGADTNPAHAVTVNEGDKVAVLETNPALVTSPTGLNASIEHSAF